MKKNFFIYLNETSTSHLFLLNKNFLQFLVKKGRVTIISHNKINDLKKIVFLKKYNFIYVPKKKLDIFFKNSYVNKILKQFRLHTCYKYDKNITIKNFNEIFINTRFKNKKIISYIWKLLQILFFKIKFIHNILNLIQRLSLPNEVKKIFRNKKNSILIISSPGWWNYDQFFLAAAKKSKLKTWSFVMNWDQSSAMGLTSDKVDHYFVWSENMKRDLIEFNNVESKRISVTGPMIYNNFYPFARKYIKNKNKNKNKKILIALRSPTRERENEVELFLQQILKIKLNYNVKFIVKFHPIHFSKRFYKNAFKILKKFKHSKKISFYNAEELKLVSEYKNLNDKDGDVIKLIKNFSKELNKKIKLYKEVDLIISFFSTINLEASFFRIPSINFLEKNVKLKKESLNKKQIDLGINVFHIDRSVKNKSLILVLGYKQLKEKINFLLKNMKFNKNILKYEINNLNDLPVKNVIKKINYHLSE